MPVPAANPRAFSTFAGRAHGTALGAAPAVRRAFGVRYASTFKVEPRSAAAVLCRHHLVRALTWLCACVCWWASWCGSVDCPDFSYLVCVLLCLCRDGTQTAYEKHVSERAALGVVPKPISAAQCSDLVKLLENPPKGEEEFLLNLLTHRVPPGVDEAAYVKADFLTAIVKGKTKSPLIDAKHAVKLLGTMQGGYNVQTLIEALDTDSLAPTAAEVCFLNALFLCQPCLACVGASVWE